MVRELVFVTSGLMLILNTVYSAHAQVSIDVSKITCEQFYKYRITTSENIAIWLSGFNHGKRNDTVVDAQGLKSNAKKLVTYCYRNPQTLLIHAVETALGGKK